MTEPSWLEPDWEARPPKQSVLDRAPLVVEQVGTQFAAVDEVIEELRSSRPNGGAEFSSVKCAAESWDWAASRNRFTEVGFLSRVFASSITQAAFPNLSFEGAAIEASNFTWQSDAFRLSGDWAWLLFDGDVYGNFRHSAGTAKRLSEAAVHELIQDRYDEVNVFSTAVALTPWYGNSTWDSTDVLIDKRHRIVHILTVTDWDGPLR